MTVPDIVALLGTLDELWAGEGLPVLCDYVRIPNVSPLYCPTWSGDGHMDEAAALLESWAAARPVAGLQAEVVRLTGRTPVLVVDVPAFGPAGSDSETVLVYGHFDKQPGLDGWRAGLGPFTPVLEGDLLYGRGSSDDGYSLFCVLLALEAAQRHGASHHRVVVLVEGSEESGSADLPAYLDHLAPMLGRPSLVIGLDSEAPTGDRLWTTTSLRGLVSLVLQVSVLAHGVHGGLAGGVVPSRSGSCDPCSAASRTTPPVPFAWPSSAPRSRPAGAPSSSSWLSWSTPVRTRSSPASSCRAAAESSA